MKLLFSQTWDYLALHKFKLWLLFSSRPQLIKHFSFTHASEKFVDRFS